MKLKLNLSKNLFFLLMLLLSVNLGKHFILKSSLVLGILSDYLVPTIYLQDILILGILFSWFLEKGFPTKDKFIKFFNNSYVQLIILFLFSVGFSVISSQRVIPSLSIFLRVLLYFSLSFYISYEIIIEKDFGKILKIISYSVIFLSVVALIQFLKQRSVFNNYLFLGEQPYRSYTWGIARETIFGITKIPSYALFRHPNIFGGFLSIVLIWIYAGFDTIGKDKRLLKTAFFLGILSLFLTFSYVAWAGFAAGFLSYLFIKYVKGTSYQEKKKSVLAVFLGVIFAVNLFTPFLVGFTQESFFRRGNLLAHSLIIIKKFPLFGVGPGSFPVFVNDINFMQPVHNIFFLLFSESGIFAFLLFVSIISLAIKKTLTPGYFSVFLISILQIIFEGSLDHYFLTIHQTSLLFWILIGLVFSDSEKKKSL